MKGKTTIKPLSHEELWVAVFLVAAIVISYWGIWTHDFVNYDDPLYVNDNPHILKGLSTDGILWALTSLYACFWHPLTWLSYLADFQLFGLVPGGFLFTNLLLHVLSALILFATLRNMTGSVWRSALVAALFALHPLNVESVAWVAERKNTLSTFFWMLTLWGYGRYAQQPSRGRFFLVLAFFLAGLTAKPMLVTLPFVLLLLDYWPLGRWQPGHHIHGWRLKAGTAVTVKHLVLEKTPFFLMSAVFSVIAYVAQDKGGALETVGVVPLSARIANAVVSYALYLRKMIWPVDLTVLYPHGGMPSWEKIAGASAIIVLATLFACKTARTRPWFIVGWLWYLGTLVPVIGLVQIGIFSMADRFAYIPLIGIFIMLAWIGEGYEKADVCSMPWRMGICWTAVLAMLVLSTQKQVGYWKDSTHLFKHALTVVGGHPLIHNSLGVALADAGRLREAVLHYRQALALQPGDGETLSNLGAVLIEQGDVDQGRDCLLRALEIDPKLKKAHNNLANLYARQGRLKQAIAHYRMALDIDPASAVVHNNLGVALLRQDKKKEAISEFKSALEIDPGYSSPMKNLEKVMERQSNLNK